MAFKDITVRQIYSNRLIEASDTQDSDLELLSTGKKGIIDLGDFAQVGSFSTYLKVTGSGSLELLYLLSQDNITWLIPSGAAPIVSGFTSSDGTSGEDILEFNPEFARFIKFRASEIGGVDSLYLTMQFAVQ